MSKFEIEVEGLPEGWQAVAIRKALDTDTHVFIDGEVFEISKHPEMLNPKNWPHLIVKKKRPRRITFEETDEKVNDLCGRHWVKVVEKCWRMICFDGTGFNYDISDCLDDLYIKKKPTLAELIAIKPRLCWV